MNVQTFAVEVNDGSTYPPSRFEVEKHIELNENLDSRLDEQSPGYIHAKGKVRPALRYGWKYGNKTSNGCTFPTREAAKIEGEKHKKRVTK